MEIRTKLRNLINYILFIMLLVLFVLPFIWVFYTSFKTNKELILSPWGLPTRIYFDNYVRALITNYVGRGLLNSVFYGMVSIFSSTIIGAMAAYVLAKFNFRGSKAIFYYIIPGSILSPVLAMIPTYRLLILTGLNNSIVGLLLVYIAWCAPFACLIIHGNYRSFPSELIEVSRLEGCNYFNVFWKIVLPIAKAPLMVVSIFNFIWVWNDILFPLVIINKPELQPAPLAITMMNRRIKWSGDWVSLFAAVVITAIPVLLIYLFASRRIIEGATVGAIKG